MTKDPRRFPFSRTQATPRLESKRTWRGSTDSLSGDTPRSNDRTFPMDKILVRGNGPLQGETYASGAKNAALPILCSSLLAEGEHTYRNVPELVDVNTTLKLLRTMGCEAQ